LSSLLQLFRYAFKRSPCECARLSLSSSKALENAVDTQNQRRTAPDWRRTAPDWRRTGPDWRRTAPDWRREDSVMSRSEAEADGAEN